MAYYVNSGQVSNGISLNNDNMFVLNGGKASNTTVGWNANLYISNGGSANVTAAADGGWVQVSGGGFASNTTLNNKGRMTVSSGGIAESTVISGGTMYVSAGASMLSATLYGGYLHLSGGTMNGTIPTVSDVRVSQYATVDVCGEHTFVSGILLLDGVLRLEGTDVTAKGIDAHHATVNLFSGGTLSSASIYDSAAMTVFSGGYASETVLLSNTASMAVRSSGSANKIDVTAGILTVESGGTTTSATVRQGTFTVESGGEARSTFVSSGGVLDIRKGGSANILRISSGAATAIQVAPDTRIVNGRYGDQYFTLEGGVLNNFDLNSGCAVGVFSGGTAYLNNTVISAGATLKVFDGGKVTGRIEIEEGAKVSAETGGIFEFDFTGRGPGEAAMINDLSLIAGDPGFTILVSTLQPDGSYLLAEGAAGFGGTISVSSTESFLGDLSVGGMFVSDDRRYSLSLSGDDLSFTISDKPASDPRTNFLENGVSQILAWDAEQGKVGYMATNGNPAPNWQGVWEWSGAEASLWKVVGAGHFPGSTGIPVNHDGILLYNGTNNTFAAWTDLNDPSYGYVSLCHVDGNFQTNSLTDLDGDEYDDVLIFNEKGSFGVVLDAVEYHDIWHVDDPASNVWQLVGAGNFGNMVTLLVKKTDEDAYFLWYNMDPTFETWNWFPSYIGSLDSDWTVAGIGDFSGDGVDDIAMWRKSTGEIQIWENGQASDQRYAGTLDQSQWEVAAVGDYNGDGREDLLLRELVTGWGGLGYWVGADATQWTDMNARIETDMESKFAVIA